MRKILVGIFKVRITLSELVSVIKSTLCIHSLRDIRLVLLYAQNVTTFFKRLSGGERKQVKSGHNMHTLFHTGHIPTFFVNENENYFEIVQILYMWLYILLSV